MLFCDLEFEARWYEGNLWRLILELAWMRKMQEPWGQRSPSPLFRVHLTPVARLLVQKV